MKDFFINNRKKLFESINNLSIVVLFSGKLQIKIGDEYYPFTPNRNFYYMTGIDEQNIILVMTKIDSEYNEVLYIQRENSDMAKWIGSNMTISDAKNKSGIDNIKYLDLFEEDISNFVFKNSIENLYIDIECHDINSNIKQYCEFYEKFNLRYPHININNIYNIISNLRVIKNDYEISLIKKAIDITIDGIEEIMKNCKGNTYEYELEAHFDFVLKKSGIKDKAFQSICASGKNATILHYVDNDNIINNNTLVLFDCGAQYKYYNADLTRTFPSNGKFTKLQKKIYNIVLDGQLKVINAMKPGVYYSKLNDILKEHYFCELKNMGLVSSIEDVSKYYYHNFGHFLGLETHDVGKYGDIKLKKGMVITVEPGLYIEEYEIGIRIEDDILITENGNEILSERLIKNVDDIENFMEKYI